MENFEECGLCSDPAQYDWRCIGKQDMLVPYNCIVSRPLRWINQEVWVLEGVLRRGESNIAQRRLFYINEASWLVALGESYDIEGGCRNAICSIPICPRCPVLAGAGTIYDRYDIDIIWRRTVVQQRVRDMNYLEHPNNIVKQKFVASVFSGDFDTIRQLVHDNFELHEGSGTGFAGIYRGAAGFIEFLGIFAATFDIKRLEEAGAYVSDDPDSMAFLFELEAVLRSNGAPFSSTLVEAWQFRDGKVAKIIAHYFNSPFHS